MLIEFSVENFKSFREKQTFSMTAAPRLRKKSCVFRPDVVGEKLPDLLKVAAIYGPNASGKSNLLEAMKVVRAITQLPVAEKRKLPVQPFRFDKKAIEQPTRLEYHFIQKNCRYQFELALNQARIVEERLTYFPKGKETLLYERVYNGESESYRTDGLEGEVELHKAWRNLTPPHALFISQAVANSSEELQQLRVPYDWLASGSIFISDNLDLLGKSMQLLGTKVPTLVKDLSQYLQEIDVPVTNISFETDNVVNPNTPTLDPASWEADLEKTFTGKVRHKTTFTHKTALGEVDFDYSEESKGTRSLIAFYIPWLLLPNKIVVVDEMDSSLHPKLVENLVKKHLCGEGVGQLIFTTHDTHLMDTKLLRRDQLWLTDRDINGATQLRSIHDFEGREEEDIEKRYYEGRYRGLPILRSV